MSSELPAPAVSTVGHPDRDPDTGLVDEAAAIDWAAGDDPEQAFGDGRSIVNIGAQVTNGRLHLWCQVLPTEAAAPCDSSGWPMNHFLVRGDSTIISDGVDTADPLAAVDWFAERGIARPYAARVVDRAFTEAELKTAGIIRRDLLDAAADEVLAGGVKPRDLVRILDLLCGIENDPKLGDAFDTLRELTDGLHLSRIADVRRRVEMADRKQTENASLARRLSGRRHI